MSEIELTQGEIDYFLINLQQNCQPTQYLIIKPVCHCQMPQATIIDMVEHMIKVHKWNKSRVIDFLVHGLNLRVEVF